ncbi:hypothetical protein [Endozoicomonas sp. SESOKO1]|uniref:hypothetical protein n=1 Tax=Endozoicomonas sp. SESOKO1 TaxID=2828742 RepID=UPI002148729C|nr:hypothetical protein [Endozoicomonas sp. SESOKO1]
MLTTPSGMKLPEKKFWVFSAGADHSDNPYGIWHLASGIWHRYPATSSVPLPVIGQSMGGVREYEEIGIDHGNDNT